MFLNVEEGRMYSRAIQYAAAAHANQMRKYTCEPYILHPIEVAELLRKHDMPINVIVAGVLHDVIEDTNKNYRTISFHFGKEIANIVQGVTNPATDKNTPREYRFWKNVSHLEGATEESQNVKCCDIISNCRGFREGNESFTAQYMAEKVIVLDHLHLADSILIQEARNAIDRNLMGILAEHRHCLNMLYKAKPE